MSAVLELIAFVRRLQWRSVGGEWECVGCGTICLDRGTHTRGGHSCSLTRTLDEAERETSPLTRSLRGRA